MRNTTTIIIFLLASVIWSDDAGTDSQVSNQVGIMQSGDVPGVAPVSPGSNQEGDNAKSAVWYEIEKARKVYLDLKAKAMDTFVKKGNILKERAGKVLARDMAAAKSAGDLDKVLALQKEIESIDLEKVDDRQITALFKRIVAEKEKAEGSATEKYVAFLKKKIAECTRADRIADAKAWNDELKQMQMEAVEKPQAVISLQKDSGLRSEAVYVINVKKISQNQRLLVWAAGGRGTDSNGVVTIQSPTSEIEVFKWSPSVIKHDLLKVSDFKEQVKPFTIDLKGRITSPGKHVIRFKYTSGRHAIRIYQIALY